MLQIRAGARLKNAAFSPAARRHLIAGQKNDLSDGELIFVDSGGGGNEQKVGGKITQICHFNV